MLVRAKLSHATTSLRGPPREDGSPGGEQRPELDDAVEGTGDGERALVCRACDHLVTHPSARMQVRGEHEHVCVNPSGIAFRIGCFRVAPGVVPHGPSYDYWSWFAGYRWQIVLCGGCRTHLGWAFHGEAGLAFFGLVTPRLRERDAEGES